MKYLKKVTIGISMELILILALFCLWNVWNEKSLETSSDTGKPAEGSSKREEDYIKWVDFNVSYEALNLAYEYDVNSKDEEVRLNWIELLAYAGAKNGGKFPSAAIKDINDLAEKLQNKGNTLKSLTKDMEYFDYYYEAYSAVLGGFVGEYKIEVPDEGDGGEKVWVEKYGLKAFSPIAKGFGYSDYDDFGNSRNYGYKRLHLGHDMMGQIGTPIIAVESGYVEAMGWNQYGGWRLGIRSFDGKRYYYYAHLRQNFPYNKSLKEGSAVQAGDVIGYMGHTGYSTNENVNNIETVHLHFGMQLIFHESQKEGSNEIWIDCYSIVRFLYKNRSETVKDEETKEWHRIYDMKDPAYLDFIKKKK